MAALDRLLQPEAGWVDSMWHPVHCPRELCFGLHTSKALVDERICFLQLFIFYQKSVLPLHGEDA
jgi:hypothetical protein